MKAFKIDQRKWRPMMGRTFLHPVFDYLLIGGGLSLVVIAAVYLQFGDRALVSFAMLPWLLLLSNSAHFAASSVRLYTKPGTRTALPFLTVALPIVSIAVLTLALVFAEQTGRYIQALYLTWSPFHYAAQAYGLAVMYSYRSGCALGAADKRMLWWIAILPFCRVLLDSTDKHFLWWLLPNATAIAESPWSIGFGRVSAALGVLALALPVVLYIKVWREKPTPMPLISLLVVVTNGVWFIVFTHYDAFVWATVFHGVQYLCIATIFHVKEQQSRPGNRRGPLFHTAWFYGVSLLLAYGLFNCWPQGYMLLGFGAAESVLLVIAAINIHHFIVDAYIWKLRPGDTNRGVVEETPAAAAAAG